MSIHEKISLKQYVELAEEIKERYEYLNVEQASASPFIRLFRGSSMSSNAGLSSIHAGKPRHAQIDEGLPSAPDSTR